MKYTLKQLRYLVAVAERGNLSAAAGDLYLSQPALSSAIAQLEQVFDTQLLVRHKARGVSLTRKALAFAECCREFFAVTADC